MALIAVRATVALPPNDRGAHIAPGDVFFVDPSLEFVATQLGVGHLVPIGKIPRLEPEPASSDDS